MSRHLAVILRLLATLLMLGTGANVFAADTSCTGLGGTIEDISGSGSCSGSGSTSATKRAWYFDADGDGYYDANICCCPSGADCKTASNVPDGYTAANSGLTNSSGVGTVDSADYDCDETSGSINPGASEVCDASNVDENCNGVADDADTTTTTASKTTYYRDSDVDTYGNPSSSKTQCEQPTGYVTDNTDCDDTSSSINTAGTEVCDSANADEDCNGLADDNDPGVATSGMSTFYKDGDSDTYGDTSSTKTACDKPTGYVTDNTDCDDTKSSVNPGKTEVCDSSDVDENCNGVADDNDSGVSSTGKTTYYLDSDSDGQGTSTSSVSKCDKPTGYSTSSTDCDDADATVYLGATEIVGDEIDEDCNGKETCYIDTDGDSYRRDPSYYTVTTTTSTDSDCIDVGEASSAAPATDCNDTDSAVKPTATEIAGDNVDQDCDTTELCYYDSDNDGYRLSTTFTSTDTDCNDSGEGLATDPATDCDDTSSSVNPGATETVGDGIDENCDGSETCYVDADNDGYRTSSTVVSSNASCTDSGEALSTTPGSDCNDTDDTVNPGATETANGVDDDCDGIVDNGTTARDLDGDCYCENDLICSSSVNSACTTLGTGDCDDTVDTTYPSAEETNNGVDDDCDGIIDNGTKVYDDDGDCYCDDTAIICTGSINSACSTVLALDCNDKDDTVSPDATDVWYDGYDDDCQGDNDYDQDVDGYVDNGYDGASTTIRGTTTVVDSGTLPAGDCDDTDATINPAASETWYDGIDEDCDGLSDYDQDYDGYVPTVYETSTTIDPGTGAVVEDGSTTLGNDCDDTDDTVNPSVSEIWYDGIDQNCDSASDYDQDGDGYIETIYDGALTVDPGTGATVEDGSTTTTGDCDDTDLNVNPAVAETWYDGIDENCDSYNDYDQDGDGYVPTAYDSAVTTDPGTGDIVDSGTLPSGDCDDTDDLVNPGVAETWYDGLDEDCDSANDYDQDGDGYVADGYVGLPTYDPGTGDVVDSGTLPGGECDDTQAGVGPGNDEIWYNGVDDDCQLDDDYDQDGDGYVPTTYSGLVTYEPDGTTVSGSGALPDNDCDDTDSSVNPSVTETWYDGLDENCDQASDYDEDGDGYVSDQYDAASITYDPGTGLAVESGETTQGGDCIDSWTDLSDIYSLDSTSGKDPYYIHPYATEECEGFSPGDATQVDDDCDGDVNTSTDSRGRVTYAENKSGDVYYPDNDNDLFGDATAGAGLYLCEVPATGYSSTYGDCDDTNANRHPGATELCNAIDDNCDEQVDEASNLPENTGDTTVSSGCVTLYSDRDNDGYGSQDPDDALCMCTDQTSVECGDGFEYNDEDGLCYTLDNTDCYDRDSTIKPRAVDDTTGEKEELVEYIDGHDNDCDGYVPIVELDCDNDGSLPILPVSVSSSEGVTDASELGLADCRGPDGVSEPDCCLNSSCDDASVCDDLVSIDQTVTCWDDEEMRVSCDSETGLIVVSRDYDTDGTHFDGGRRIYSGAPCSTDGDCDDLCIDRCPDMTETCDGMDNDCNNASQLLGDADDDGVPDAMDTDGVPNDLGISGVIPGYVNIDELDLDGDGYLGCTTDDLVERTQTSVSYEGCSTSENLGDCNNTCYLSSPVAEEERCDGFLDICDGDAEGTDADRDDFATCGAWGPEDGELAEDIYVLVYVPGLNEADTGGVETGLETGETGSSETGTHETGSSETGTHETGSSETGASETGASETGASETGASETGTHETGATETGASTTDTSADTGTSTFRRPATRAHPWSKDRILAASDLDVGVIPLVLPRALAPECDTFLSNRLTALIGTDELQYAVDNDTRQPLLELCMKAEACREKRAGDDTISWPSDCSDIEGQCTVVRLTLDTGADDDLYDSDVVAALDEEADCSSHPEQSITRSVWNHDRITHARELVVEWECFRMDGTYGCGDLTAPDDWVSPYPDGTLPGGNFSNADPGTLLTRDDRWWKELTRFNPEAQLEGVFSGCWGDPSPGTGTLSDVVSQDVGGDCSDSDSQSNRGKVEGPDDLLGIYLYPGVAGDCSLCLDGIDNNCNGLTDCAEPACARCFVGQGTGCGGGSSSPCAQSGCSTPPKQRNSGVDPSGLLLVGLGIVSLGYRWRRQR